MIRRLIHDASAANPGVVVDAATPDSVPRLAEIASRCYQSAFSSILEPEALASRDASFFRGHFADCWPRTTIATLRGRIAGFSLVSDSHLDMLFVDPTNASNGIGTLLLDHATKKGLRSIECFRDNESARRFYEHRGWIVERVYQREFLGKPRDFVRYIRRAPASSDNELIQSALG
ncbi:MAG: GNAT family N-acetyltransferase [Planctomycetaceae bacterium]|nr:GNAT family N-acetyltransferase [Planctomycetaceae bacterium]